MLPVVAKMFSKRIANLNMCKLLVSVSFTVVATDESVGQRDIAVISGSTASFTCIIHAPESNVYWLFQTNPPETSYYLYIFGDLTPDCDNKCDVTFNNKSDLYTLTIHSVQLYDAGFYECGEHYTSVKHFTHLIVIQPADITQGMLNAQVGSLCFIILQKRSLT